MKTDLNRHDFYYISSIVIYIYIHILSFFRTFMHASGQTIGWRSAKEPVGRDLKDLKDVFTYSHVQ